MIDDSLVVLEPQARSLTDRETHRREKANVIEENECLYMSERVRGQVPGATRNGARNESAINNTQTSGYGRAPEGVARLHNGIKR